MTAEEIMNTRVEFNSIEKIRNHSFYGNHAFDHQAFQGIHRFVKDESNSLADRAEAVRIKCDRGMDMPLPSEESDEEVLKKALALES